MFEVRSMFVDKEHADYDAKMEVALFIPKSPGMAGIALIAEDLCVGNQIHVQDIIRTLKDDPEFFVSVLRGRRSKSDGTETGVRTSNVKKVGRCVQVAPGAWPAFRKRCEAYWSKVYGKSEIESKCSPGL